MAKAITAKSPAAGAILISGMCLLLSFGIRAEESLEKPAETIWEAEPGQGFKSGTQTLTLEAGANWGIAAFGSRQAHDLALLSLSYGRMLGEVVGRDQWYRGNWELRGELLGGAEFRPDQEWLIGLTPHLRYNFAVARRCVLFVDAGAGVTATGIGPPDLSNTFEFNLQGGCGVQCFIGNDFALTVEARYLHLSCAGISKPNLGLNGITGMIGLTRFF